MSDFSLVVSFKQEESSCCEKELIESLQTSVDNSLDKLLVVDAKALSLYLSTVKTSNENHTTVAIFIPPSILESHLNEETVSISPNHCNVIRHVSDAAIQTKILSQVHENLMHEDCRISAILRCVDGERSRDSDVLLLDISDCYGGWLNEMRQKLCGEPMVYNDAVVIEMVAIHQVAFSESSISSLMGQQYEVPTCAVCLHRIHPPRLGMPKLRNDQLCSEYCASECRNEQILKPWPPPSDCKACKMIHHQWNNINDDVFCYCCALQETLWICLTCGFIGCGRYSQGHAANHFQESKHAFSLEMATLRVWDYPCGEFAHRGDLLECPSVRKHHPQWAVLWGDDKVKSFASSCPEPSPKKAAMIGEEYEALLQSALEDQAQHYEGEISRLHAALTCEQIDENTITERESAEIEELKTEISCLREDLDRLGRNFLEMQAQEAGHRAASQRLLREQSVAKDLLDKIREESHKEHQHGRLEVEDLEQQVADLTANLAMRHQILQDEELNQAQIYGTVTGNSLNKSSVKRGKKSRRGNRKG